MRKFLSSFLPLLLCALSITYLQSVNAGISGMTPEDKLKAMGITLYEPPPACASYVLAKRVGNLVYLSGSAPKDPKTGEISRGKLGVDLTAKQGNEAAKNTGIFALSVLKQELGDLSRIKNVVKIIGYVNVDPSFTDLSVVVNGFCDLMTEVFGDKGKSPRSSIGVASLPYNKSMVIEIIVEVTD